MMKSSEKENVSKQTKQMTFRMPENLLEQFRQKAVQNHQKMNGVFIDMISRYVSGEMGTTTIAAAPVCADPRAYMLRAFATWLPVVFLIKEVVEGRVLFANPEFLTLVDRTDVFGYLPADYWDASTAESIMMRDRMVRTSETAMLSQEEVPGKTERQWRLTIRFPVVKNGRLVSTGALGFNADQLRAKFAELVPGQNGKKFCRLRKVEFATGLGIGTADSLLSEVIDALPATVAIKELNTNLVYANREYERVTNKPIATVLNRPTWENWPGPEGALIMMHDELVRESKVPWLSIETLPKGTVGRTRLNLRFPIFNLGGELEFTGTLGFNSEAIDKALKLLSTGGSAVVKLSDDPSLLEECVATAPEHPI